ncbi:MAG: pilus (MSHA type) biogenesis protein MshL [Campylobacterota bacterium]|nr:pilus (MSHA type) biogenesis protein MshL [Campylobacterota bacterium]
MKYIRKTIYGLLLALLMSSTAYADCTYELFSISSTKNTKIIDFIEQLSDECEFSVIVSDPVAEKYLDTQLNKTHLKNLTIDEVLSIILKENNLYYSLENNLLKISYLNTKIFGIDYILSQRKGVGKTNVTLSSSSASQQGVNSGGATGSGTSGGNNNNQGETGIIIESSDEVIFWEELDKELQSVINRPHDEYVADAPIINKNAGLVTVTATHKQMSRLERYLKRLQDKVQLQVLIDVQLLSVTMTEGTSTGIDWQQLYALQNFEVAVDTRRVKNVTEFKDASITEATLSGLQGVASMVSIAGGGNLNEVIKFLKTQGDVSSISNPKVLTLNNQPALITAGTEYFYKILNTETLAGGTTGVQNQNESIQSVFAGVLLTITPEIADDKTITLKINPSLSETASNMEADGADRKMPPDLNRRQLSSVVTVKDGNRIILGGLINTRNIDSSSKVPLLGDIPGLSYLFKYEETTKQVQELVIVIQPHIIEKEKSSLSLKDLGYEGITDQTVIFEKASISQETDNITKQMNKKLKDEEDEI